MTATAVEPATVAATVAAADGPANSEVVDNNRTYTHPVTGEQWTSVTTLLGAMPKDGLPYWAAREVADAALDLLPLLVRATMTRPCGKGTSDDRCRVCPDCVRYRLRLVPEELRDSAGDRGRRVHHLADMYVKTGEMGAHDDDIADYVRQYLAWEKLMRPEWEMTEATVINRRHGYAGTLDGIARFGWLPPKYAELIGQPLVVDLKTAKHTYPDNAAQLAAYRNAETIMLRDGTELPLPPTAGAVIVHLRPDFFQTHFVAAADEDLDGFLAVAGLHRWLNGRGKQAVERAMYKPRPRKPSATKPTPAPTPARRAEPAPTSAAEQTNPYAEYPGDPIPF